MNDKKQPSPGGAENLVYGRNAVLETFKAGRTVDKLYLSAPSSSGSLCVILAKAREQNIPIVRLSRQAMDRFCNTASHQGVAVSCAAHEYAKVSDMLEDARSKAEDPFLILCESIQDPYNLGAIIRTAEAAGAHGVVVSSHYAVGLTDAVAKTAAGTLEYMKVAKVSSIASLLLDLKKEGLWTACADMHARSVFEQDMTGPLALVIGGEHEGITPLVKKRCDFSVSLPMTGHAESLNASVAAGILIYETARQRWKKLQHQRGSQ